MGFLYCVIYAAVIGLASFLLGRLVPGAWFHEDRFPYKAWAWEQGGSWYTCLGIRKWQAKVPDMSRILPGTMQAKKVTSNFPRELPGMITETCIAEWIHVLLCILILPCLWIWQGWGGIAFVVVYILTNIPFVMIQRYNRPRLIRLRDKMEKKGNRK